MELGDLEFGAHETIEPSRVDERPRRLLPEMKRVAIVGASDNPLRKSYRVLRFLVDHGVDVTVSGPGDVATLDASIDAVVVFCKPTEVGTLASNLAKTGAPAVWFQEGLIDSAAARLLEEAGKVTIMDRCVMRDYRRYVLGENVETWFPV